MKYFLPVHFFIICSVVCLSLEISAAEGLSKEITDFYLWRHGETEANKEGLLSGGAPEVCADVLFWTQVTALTEKGREQAKELGKMVASQCVLDVIYTSDLTRAYDTAAAVVGAYQQAGHPIELRSDKQLREILHGEHELTSVELRNERAPKMLTELLENADQFFSDDKFLAWKCHPLVPIEGIVDGEYVIENVVDVDKYIVNREKRPETAWQLFHRIIYELAKIAEENPEKKIGISTHGAVLATLLEGLDEEFEGTYLPPHYNNKEIRMGNKVIPRAFQVKNCALFHIQYDHVSKQLTIIPNQGEPK